MENTEGSPTNRVTKLGQVFNKAAKRTRHAYNKVAEWSGLAPEKIPAERIDEHAVTKTIIGSIWAEHMRFGDKTDDPISPATILANMGHPVLLNTDDYRQKHPKEYQALRNSLDSLVQDGVLERVPLDNPDANNESIYYRAVNKDALRQLAANPQTGFPVKP